MAPEQLSGGEVTVRSDIYALGLVLYEVFTGQRALEGRNLAELIKQREQSGIVPPERTRERPRSRHRERHHALPSPGAGCPTRVRPRCRGLTSGRRSARGGACRRRNAIAGDGRCRRDDRRDEQPAHDDGSRVDGCVPRRRAPDVSARAARESRSYSEACRGPRRSRAGSAWKAWILRNASSRSQRHDCLRRLPPVRRRHVERGGPMEESRDAATGIGGLLVSHEPAAPHPMGSRPRRRGDQPATEHQRHDALGLRRVRTPVRIPRDS